MPLAWRSVSLAAWFRSLSLQAPCQSNHPLSRGSLSVTSVLLRPAPAGAVMRLHSAAAILGARDHLCFLGHILLFPAPQLHVSAYFVGCSSLVCPASRVHQCNIPPRGGLPPKPFAVAFMPASSGGFRPCPPAQPSAPFHSSLPTQHLPRCLTRSLPSLPDDQIEVEFMPGMPTASCRPDLLTRARPFGNEEGVCALLWLEPEERFRIFF